VQVGVGISPRATCPYSFSPGKYRQRRTFVRTLFLDTECEELYNLKDERASSSLLSNVIVNLEER
jgi:hypothetical protein